MGRPLALGALLLTALVCVPAAGASTPRVASSSPGTTLVAVRAGTIYCVEENRVLEGGAVILIEDGKIIALGEGLAIPPHAELVDYGPDAVIVPGLVAPFSSYAIGRSSRYSASPGTLAVDNFDPYEDFVGGLSGGVTSAYITPSESRLISGVGALVKLAGKNAAERIVNPRAALHVSVDALARNAPGFWDPPLPATAETEMGYSKPQLPATAMGAIVALTELVDGVRAKKPMDPVLAAEYGSNALLDLTPIIEAGTPWRISAVSANEIRAVLRFAARKKLPLILEKGLEAGELAKEIAAAGVPVIFRVPFQPGGAFADRGKGRDANWGRLDVPALLAAEGVRVAIASRHPIDLLFSAGLATRGGLDKADALRAITLTSAELSGAADRVGSLAVGKDADLCVLGDAPFSGFSNVLATWVDGRVAWKAHATLATVIEVEELHVGDGSVLRPGALLIEDGEIVEVGERVSRPRGARIVRGAACMPGIIDAFGHLGLAGSKTVPATDFDLSSIVVPGDRLARRVARHGITTVVLTPRAASTGGAPIMAYKPAADEFESQIVRRLTALRLNWGDKDPLKAGKSVKALLAKAAGYDKKWREYEKAIAGWTPPPLKPTEVESEEEEDKGDAEEEDADKEETKKKSKKSKKKKKKEEEVLEPDPLTGRWVSAIASEDGEELSEGFKMRLRFALGEGSGEVLGNLRCARASGLLVDLQGYWDRDEKTLKLTGLGDRGWLALELALDEDQLTGTLLGIGLELEIAAKRTTKDYVVAERAERRSEEVEKVKAPKGKPKMPRLDPKLEPLRAALKGELAIVVEVNREDAILECVETFESYGIQPVLLGARDVHLVALDIVDRVAGILIKGGVRRALPKRGTDYLTPYGDLQNIGIPVAFHSEAEEGASDLSLVASFAVANGMSPTGALRALTGDAARMMSIEDHVGRLARGLDADVILLDGPPLAPGTSIERIWVDGKEIR